MNDADKPVRGHGSWGTTPRDRRNLAGVVVVLVLWAGAFVGGSWLIRNAGIDGVAGVGLAVLAQLLGVLLVLAYARYLAYADELQRLIQMWGLAFGYGGAWLAMTGYRLFELLGAPVMDGGTLMFIMAATYTVGVWVGWRRYS